MSAHWKPLNSLEIKLAEAAVIKLMRARFPGRPVTVRHANQANPVLKPSTPGRHNDSSRGSP
jgi:hypothetical protein